MDCDARFSIDAMRLNSRNSESAGNGFGRLPLPAAAVKASSERTIWRASALAASTVSPAAAIAIHRERSEAIANPIAAEKIAHPSSHVRILRDLIANFISRN